MEDGFAKRVVRLGVLAAREVLSRNVRQLLAPQCQLVLRLVARAPLQVRGLDPAAVRRAPAVDLELDEGDNSTGGVAQLLDEHDDVIPRNRPACSGAVGLSAGQGLRVRALPREHPSLVRGLFEGGHDVSWLPPK